MSSIAVSSKAAEEMFAKLRELQRESSAGAGASALQKEPSAGSSLSFFDQLKAGVAEVDQAQKSADKMATEVASGKSGNLHETMLAISTAELQFNLMVQIRNRALEAYQEVMRMQV